MIEPTSSQVTTFLKQFFRNIADQDDNGIITYPEFIDLVLNNFKLTPDEINIWEKFQTICGDADIINEERFVNFFKKAQSMFKEKIDSESISSIGGMFGAFRKVQCPLEAAIMMDLYNNPVRELASVDIMNVKVLKSLMKTADPSAKDLLKFWFPTDLEDAMRLWFGKSPQVDMMIKMKYEQLFMKASQGDLDHWLANPMDCLALLILLDQVPRNIYRHSKEMYSGDSKALAIVMKAFYYQHFKHLTPIQCVFLPCLVLTHSESVYCQRLCLDVWTNFVGPRLNQDSQIRYFGDIFQHHWQVITRFGRFPHRNEILGRETTTEEEAFLLDTSYRFDLPLVFEKEEDEPAQIKFETNADFTQKEAESKTKL